MQAAPWAEEFLQFLKQIDRCVQDHLDVHLVLDNYATHKTPSVNTWLAKHKRFKLHFTPTSASWLNLVERFFAEITRKRIRRGGFTSVAQLQAAIHDYLDHHNANPRPFVWTKTADVILTKERRALDALEAVKDGYQASELGTLDERGDMERTARIELASSAWKAAALPLSYARCGGWCSRLKHRYPYSSLSMHIRDYRVFFPLASLTVRLSPSLSMFTGWIGAWIWHAR